MLNKEIICPKMIYKAFKNYADSVKYLKSFIKDITERKRAGKQLKENEQKYKTIFNSSPHYMIIIGLDGNLIDVNKAACEVVGLSREELIGRNFTELDLLLDEEMPLHVNNISHVLKGNKTKIGVSRFIDRNGEIRYVKTYLTPLKMNNEIFALNVICHDISEHKKAKEALKTSELYYRTIFENTGTATLIIGEDIVISLANTEFEKLSGYSKEELEGKKSLMDFAIEEDLERLISYHNLRKNDPDSAPKNYEIKLINKQGDIRDVYVTIDLIPYTRDRVISLLDITDKKRSKGALIESKNHYRKLLENSFDAVVIHSEGKIISANSAAIKLLGVKDPDKYLNKSLFNFVHPKYDKIVSERVQNMLEKGEAVPPIEEKFVRPDGTIVYVEVLATAFIYDGKKAVQVVFRDISERKKAENDIKASLKEKETLLMEIHHRVKNNLQIISSLLDLQANYVDEQEAINVLQESQNRVQSMAIIHEMLYQSIDLTSIDFISYIENLAHDLFLSYGAKNHIKFFIKSEPILLNIETAVPCGLILSELISNSLKYAFPNHEPGKISVSINSYGEEFELIISDNGIGFPENIDFKSVNSSLGLRLVNTLVNQLEGSIELDKTEGTKFKIKFKELEYNKRF
ncbi:MULTISPECIES: PAS domain S-box protein [Methanobacterium]|uniref:PAS domain S-box protein n=1 Tax=Methanobacterium veterum TaxID=408577 RepID=A0A9E5A176_9EURY|nr:MULTISPECIES: PAS domain S-box protein [Methanobacterium]MCZ3364879.1 PAS domain S-box protein [Methanobacterium veterum]MCZ3372634.1 PAS domain S-box protein [Methanobacterium veterum]